MLYLWRTNLVECGDGFEVNAKPIFGYSKLNLAGECLIDE
jgi:hypothetical protein